MVTEEARIDAKFLDGAGEEFKSNDLPNPVFMAVGENTMYAFKFKPSWFTCS